jgi:hypothetical protein
VHWFRSVLVSDIARRAATQRSSNFTFHITISKHHKLQTRVHRNIRWFHDLAGGVLFSMVIDAQPW